MDRINPAAQAAQKELILIKVGELALKGLNRRTFEDVLMKNLRRRLAPLGRFEVRAAQSTITVTPLDADADLHKAAQRVAQVFGIAAFSRAGMCEKDLEDIQRTAAEYLAPQLEQVSSFKVEAKRSDKSFPLKSPAICEQVGGYLLDRFPHLHVDVHQPELTVMVEVRDFGAYVHGQALRGAGGIPVGTGGKAAVLISGGIDSPVAAWMMAKRGLELHAVHFASPPYTSERAEDKVHRLLRQVAAYSGRIALHTVPFTHIQEEIRNRCPEELFTILMRRMMMRLAQRVAGQTGCSALITGESLGQVASQTVQAVACTDAVCTMPVLRPLIGMDKEEIIAIARKINTFDISIEPYEDCCTVFTPRHPRTRPVLKFVELAEQALDIPALEEEALAGVRSLRLSYEEG
ncbi:MAG TPA: tRNA 4-thiouridine(8) synthase ThiI [Candidatus Gallacutalibacter stercoravium]|nr:tRNA 4-thiouridine(8) synthase ThiI [Candidatus Gallacutalibacter stercoravium]